MLSGSGVKSQQGFISPWGVGYFFSLSFFYCDVVGLEGFASLAGFNDMVLVYVSCDLRNTVMIVLAET